MKIFVDYLKKIVPTLIWTAFFLGIFALVCFLYDVPVQPAGYTAQVTVVFGVLALAVGFFRFRRKYRELEKTREDLRYAGEFPAPGDAVEKLYQEIAAALKDQMIEMEQKDQSSYREMVEYYTL